MPCNAAPYLSFNESLTVFVKITGPQAEILREYQEQLLLRQVRGCGTSGSSSDKVAIEEGFLPEQNTVLGSSMELDNHVNIDANQQVLVVAPGVELGWAEHSAVLNSEEIPAVNLRGSGERSKALDATNVSGVAEVFQNLGHPSVSTTSKE